MRPRFPRLLLLLIVYAIACSQPNTPAPPTTMTRPAPAVASTAPRVILADGTPIHVEIAADDETRAQGLMYRDRVRDGWGMLFFFPAEEPLAFWMKDTLVPLDMIWIGGDLVVRSVTSDVPPCKADPCPNYPSGAPARYVLEVAAGVSRAHGVKPGDKLRFENLDKVVVR